MKDKVREHVTSIVDTDLLSHKVLKCKAGCVKDHVTNWKSVTADPVILNAIKHDQIEFEGDCRPVQATKPKQINISSEEKEIINAEIVKLFNKRVIKPSQPYDGDFISTIRVRSKKDGSYRLFLNL